MLLVPESTFGDKVPMQLGTQVTDTTLQDITLKELSNTGNWWRRVHLSSIISRQLSVKAGPTEILLDLNQIQGEYHN